MGKVRSKLSIDPSNKCILIVLHGLLGELTHGTVELTDLTQADDHTQTRICGSASAGPRIGSSPDSYSTNNSASAAIESVGTLGHDVLDLTNQAL